MRARLVLDAIDEEPMASAALKLISWNCNQKPASWSKAAEHGADVLLLQEATPGPVPSGLRVVAPDLECPWQTGGSKSKPWCTAVAVREGVQAKPLPLAALDTAKADELRVSRAGSLAAAELSLPNEGPIIVISIYALWEKPVRARAGDWIYADASAHRIVSDLSALLRRQSGHRLLVAGDWNILRGYGEHGSQYWRARYETVFARMDALGLRLVGPFAGRRPDPRPSELPIDSDTTPTYWPPGGQPTRQLDFVFASAELATRIRVTAFNGSSWTHDHCPIDIELSPRPSGHMPGRST
jgi:endonuclease/exonuclease/phosphatase family metal-dependent hydrolase